MSDTAFDSLEISYDLDQLPRDSLPSLRSSLFALLQLYLNGPKPIRTQLCVCMAGLAIRMTEWEDVIPSFVSAFNTSDPNVAGVILEFLTVLPEELNEGRKINLSVGLSESGIC
jgi:transportin-3